MSPRDLNGRLIPLWEAHREDKPVVTLLCGAEQGRCQKRLGKVWATPGGLLLHYFQHVAPKRFTVDASALTPEELRAHLGGGESGLRRYEPGQETGIGRGLRDDDGWLALVDDDAYWHPVEVGCLTHEGLVEVERDGLLSAALGAARRSRHVERRVRR